MGEMRIKLIFDFWEENHAKLSEGKFHAGTTFDGVIYLNAEDVVDLTEALKQGYTPVFSVMLANEEGGVMIGKNQCEHGQLARSCEICERDKEIAELKSEIARLNKEKRAGAIKEWNTREGENKMQECNFDTVVKNDVDTVYHIDSAYRDEHGVITWYDGFRIGKNGVKFRRMFSSVEITVPPIEQV